MVSRLRWTQIRSAVITEQLHRESSENQAAIRFIDLPPLRPPCDSGAVVAGSGCADGSVGADGADGSGGKGDSNVLVTGSGGADGSGGGDGSGGKSDLGALVAGSGGNYCSGGADGSGCADARGAITPTPIRCGGGWFGL
jgi:hypothetical protein